MKKRDTEEKQRFISKEIERLKKELKTVDILWDEQGYKEIHEQINELERKL